MIKHTPKTINPDVPLAVEQVEIGEILTRASGYLAGVCSHSLQPYRGCTLGRSLCGAGCYVQHNPFVTRGRAWGSFLEVRQNAAAAYRESYVRERSWARRVHGRFVIFCASSTEPFLPQERKYGITGGLLREMQLFPPDGLILQTRSPLVLRERETLVELAGLTELRIHISIEGDRDRLPGLPPPASRVARRMATARALTEAGLDCRITVAPLHPIRDPSRFFQQLAECASAVIIDHFIEGDGSVAGGRTRRTPLYGAIRQVDPTALELDYRDRIVEIARTYFPGRVGVGQAGFAGELS